VTSSTGTSLDARILRSAGVSAFGVGVVATIIGGVVAGSPGVLAGVLGTVIVVVFFSIGQFILGSVLRRNPAMAMTVAMTTYLVKIGVLLALLLLLKGATAFDPKVFGLTILCCTLTWTIAEVWVFSRAKVLYVDPSGTLPPGGL
jgi:ATP synthase protein I